jgi:hypothetical protein
MYDSMLNLPGQGPIYIIVDALDQCPIFLGSRDSNLTGTALEWRPRGDKHSIIALTIKEIDVTHLKGW